MKPKETTFQAVRRHLRNGYVILTSRGLVALYGAAMRELAKIVDSPVGVFLAPRDIFRDGPRFLKEHGARATLGALLRQTAATFDPPLGRRRNPVNDPLRKSAISYYYTYELTKPDGVIPSRRPANEMDFALETPFSFDAQPKGDKPIAAIVHCFYPEILPFVLEKLSNVPGAVDLFLSTDTEEKRRALEETARSWRTGSVDIRIFPNRGRDIAAKLFGFRDVYDNYELFLHLHTKRSPHGGEILSRWRDYIFDTLLGAPEIARSILTLFDDPKLGAVFPQHLFEVRGILNWGYDYDLARGLMRRLGVEINKNLVLEFPSGSMFWGRSAAFKPLINLDIGFDDFPEEAGQVDGTLAHAIERVLLMAAEAGGYEWLKVARRDLYPMPQTLLTVKSWDDLAEHRLKVFRPCLASVDAGLRPQDRGIVEIRPLLSYPSRNTRPRLNLLVPTVNPQQIFGGVATAMKLFTELADELGADFDRRIIATDADIDPDAYEKLSDYQAVPFVASLDAGERLLVDANEREGGRLDLRANDVFIATAWWTAGFAYELERDRERYFGGEIPFVYLIQDDETYFNGRSSRSALAEATYRHGERMIAIINSEELYAVMTKTHSFREAYFVPYEINHHVSAALTDAPRERLMLIYGRPSVTRNGFEIICDGIFRWQQRDPIRASRWRIVFLGEDFPDALLYPVMNARVGGKVSLEEYAGYLSRASIGVSIMISPHPSYPPLEMAEAGLLTITNGFEGKDLSLRFDNIVSLELYDPMSLADAIEDAVATAEPRVGRIALRKTPKAPAPDAGRRFELKAFATRLRQTLT